MSTQNLAPIGLSSDSTSSLSDLLFAIDLLLCRQPIRRHHDQRDRVYTAEDRADIVHRLEELQLGNDIRIGACNVASRSVVHFQSCGETYLVVTTRR